MLQCGLVRWNLALAIAQSLRGPRSIGWLLPAVMAEGLVGLGHPMGVFALLHRRAAVVHGIEQLIGQPLLRRVLAALARRIDDPADRQRLAPLGAHLDRHLISRTPHATGADL